MYSHPATQENLSILEKRGVTILGPAAGHLASGLKGKGRMLEPEELVGHLRVWLGKDGPLARKKVLVTAGGTQEAIDPVRMITNRSSGKQGYALAQAAVDQGGEVVLVSTPVCLAPPVGVSHVAVESADEMAEAVLKETENTDILIMAAAVADYQPDQISNRKIKKSEGGLSDIKLKETRDILKEVAKKKKGKGPTITIGFAAETENLLDNAQSKLKEKDLDLIAVNDVSRTDAGFAVDQNQVTLIWSDGKTKELPLMDKGDVASEIIQEAIKLLKS